MAFRVFEFGDFKVDCDRFELSRAGRTLKLERKPMELLILLAAGNGHLITRTEIIERLWDSEVFVDTEHGINTAIRKIRQVLGDDPERPRFVQTVTGKGYRFIAPIGTVDPSLSGDQSRLSPTEANPLEVGGAAAAPMPTTASPTQSQTVLDASQHSDATPGNARNSRIILWLAAFGAAAVFAFIAVSPAGRGLAARFLGLSARPQISSLAVLPLDNLSGDPSQDYFADGMTDELITNLSKISALRVISRTSVMAYKNAKKPLPQIARELNVDAVIEGSVLRSGDRVRITAQLLHAPTDRHLWAQSYEGDLRDILALQSEVAQAVAREIKIVVSPQEQTRLASARPVNPEAYRLCLLGRFLWNKRTEEGFKSAIDHFQRALEIDPAYAPAYAGLADSYILQGLGFLPPKEAISRGKTAAQKALDIDDSLAEAHTSLAMACTAYDWDWSACEEEFKRAIELNPNYATAHHWYGDHLSNMGRHAQAIAEVQRAQQLDPLSPTISACLAYRYFYARQYQEAIRRLRETVSLFPEFARAHRWLGDTYMANGAHQEAIVAYQKAMSLSGASAAEVAALGQAYAKGGIRGYYLWELRRLREESKHRYVEAAAFASLSAGLGEKDQAFSYLEKAYADREYGLTVLKIEPAFDPLRSDPRFQDLLRRMNFPP